MFPEPADSPSRLELGGQFGVTLDISGFSELFFPQNSFIKTPFLRFSRCCTVSGPLFSLQRSWEDVSHISWTPHAACCAAVAAGETRAEDHSHHPGQNYQEMVESLAT